MTCLKAAIIELADNPEKYPLKKFDEYNKGENQDFYFKKVATKICKNDNRKEGKFKRFFVDSMEEKTKNEEKEKQMKKIEEKSKRWGETKKIFEESKNLKPIKKQDLIIINQDSNTPFINRFNLICENFFYPLLRENNQKADFYKKDKVLLTEFIGFLTIVLENASIFYFSQFMKTKIN